ncbi:MAG: hypothetical protein JWP30_1268 [Homoserinimonas sp.]|jgi:hypothetical protein|nr:hypothetical protein [Homoserinimonas sp.]
MTDGFLKQVSHAPGIKLSRSKPVPATIRVRARARRLVPFDAAERGSHRPCLAISSLVASSAS